MERFSSTLEAISEYMIIPELPLLPPFQVIQQFKSLPDFLMFLVFLVLRHHDHSTSVFPRHHPSPGIENQELKSMITSYLFPMFLSSGYQDHSNSVLPESHFPPHMKIIHAMGVFESFANEAQERSRSTSDALKYACQNWTVHLSRAPITWDESLDRIFKSFWNRYLLSWFERQWYLKGLRSCIIILSEGEKLVKEHFLQASGSSQSSI
ncbi:uncharacterized protein EDB91DRAFT_1336628 [Suillus paluster]|uniref:uncharacterized protein n=1 Tax=Suillus paluster TaxID=48578 RepID=UPI001B867F56|nr:uncharacterized protein EDB91DRAFT_1336628 [Suillus paluster]KAG1740227.1 hypothetical protein EDB91DRAFT_1336628 [Suillus paluster]